MTISTAACGPRRCSSSPPRSATRELPTSDPAELARWFTRGADRKSLELYLEGFRHTVALLQTRDALERVAAECAEDLAADNVVYAEVRYAPELSTEGGLTLDEVVTAILAGFREGEHRARARRAADRDEAARLRHAPGGPLGRGRGARRAAPRRGRRRLRHRRAGGGLPAHAAPRRLPADPAGELPRHDPRRRELRPAVDLGGAPVVRRRAARARHANRRRHHRAAGRLGRARAPGGVRPRPPRAARDVPDVQRPDGSGRVDRGASDRPAAPPPLSRHRQHRQPADERRDA